MTGTAIGGGRIWRTRLLPTLMVLAILLLNGFVRYRLKSVPLERDEGEHAYSAQMILDGNPPFKLAYGLKLPGTDFGYAAFMLLFGETAAAIRIGLLILNAATILAVTALGIQLFGVNAGAAAGTSYGILALSQNVVGTIAHSTHFVAFFLVLSTLVLLNAGVRSNWVFCAGLGYGLAVLMKQPAASFVVFGVVCVVWQIRRCGATSGPLRKNVAAFAGGVGLPYLLLCLALWRAGVFERFWFWTVTLAQAYAGQRSLAGRYESLKWGLAAGTGVTNMLWIIAGAGLILGLRNRATRMSTLLATGLLAFSCVAVSAGGGYNPNYFLMLFPALSLLTGAFVAATEAMLCDALTGNSSMPARLLMSIPVLSVATTCGVCASLQYNYLFLMDGFEFSRASYGLNPFPEAERISEYIRTHSGADAKVAVLGSEAEIYFYSRRRAATGYLFMYSLMETHRFAAGLQGDMIGEIEAARPEFIVDVGVPTSWLIQPQSSLAIQDWLEQYVAEHYQVVGVADMPWVGPAKYVWAPNAAQYWPIHKAYLTLYQRNH